MNELEKQIAQNLKEMLETPLKIDENQKWQEFAQKITDNNPQRDLAENNRKRIPLRIKIMFTAASLLIISSCFLLKPQVVTGFKDTLYKWVNQQDENDYVFSEKRNPEYQPGLYESISLEEAKSMVVYEIRYPQYLPEALSTIEPTISVNSPEYPISTVTLKFAGEKSYLMIKQKNVLVQKNSNTFVPGNAQIKEVVVRNNIKVIIAENGDSIECHWNENNVHFQITSKSIAYEEIIDVIESLN